MVVHHERFLESIFGFSHIIRGLIKGLNTNYDILVLCKMYFHIVQIGSTRKFAEGIWTFSHLLIRGLIKGLSPNYFIISTFSLEMYHCIVQNGSITR